MGLLLSLCACGALTGCSGALAIPGAVAYSAIYSETKPARTEQAACAPWVGAGERAEMLEHWRMDVIKGECVDRVWWRLPDGEVIRYENLMKSIRGYAARHAVRVEGVWLVGVTVIALEPMVALVHEVVPHEAGLRVSTTIPTASVFEWFSPEVGDGPHPLRFDDVGEALIPVAWGVIRLVRNDAKVEAVAMPFASDVARGSER